MKITHSAMGIVAALVTACCVSAASGQGVGRLEIHAIPSVTVSNKQFLAGDTATMVGSATVEMEVLNSVTNERLAAAVDDRAGTKVLFAKRAYTTWGDVQAACSYWAGRISWQLARHGVQRKPGVGMPEEPKESRTI